MGGEGGRKHQALVYDIHPLEEGAGKRCSECGGVAQFILVWINDLDLSVSGVSKQLGVLRPVNHCGYIRGDSGGGGGGGGS